MYYTTIKFSNNLIIKEQIIRQFVLNWSNKDLSKDKKRFENKIIRAVQEYDGKDYVFEPDSSPEAWEHYRKYYPNSKRLNEKYDLKNGCFYSLHSKAGLKKGLYLKQYNKWLNYVNAPLCSENNRIYALNKMTVIKKGNDNFEYIEATDRLGGECDFNFNKKKCDLFKEIIGDDTAALEKLSYCKKMHHTLLNFSLIQAMGNMQAHKGRNRYDRLDVFVYELDLYYKGISSDVLSESAEKNRETLINFLCSFKNIYEYCQETYFIKDQWFVDKIISQGQLPIEDKTDVVRYMDLAIEFWNKKEKTFKTLDYKEIRL